uniref:Uncharacterized protein n=1 Tax=Junco hyemalis TaxID=40217 RepID=A0A8C5NHZ0_JUNHY
MPWVEESVVGPLCNGWRGLQWDFPVSHVEGTPWGPTMPWVGVGAAWGPTLGSMSGSLCTPWQRGHPKCWEALRAPSYSEPTCWPFSVGHRSGGLHGGQSTWDVPPSLSVSIQFICSP